MRNFDNLTYDQFSDLHGGKRNAALAGRFLRRRGQDPTIQMGEAMRKQAILRSLAQQQNLTDQMGGPDQPPVDPSKPLAAPQPEMAGPPLAPKVGGRTSPGTTPMKNPAPTQDWGGLSRYFGNPQPGSGMLPQGALRSIASGKLNKRIH